MLVPAFLYGTWTQVERAALELSTDWEHAFKRDVQFPQLVQRPAQPDEVVIDSHEFNYDPDVAYWRLSATFKLWSEIPESADGSDEVRTRLEAAFQTTPWGALVALARQRRSHTVSMLASLTGPLFMHWESLSTLRYLSKPRPLPRLVSYPARNRDAIAFDDHIAELFVGPLVVWGDSEGGDMRQRLERALLSMESASTDDARTRLIARMVVLARENPRLSAHKDLADTGLIGAYYDRLDDGQRAELRPGESVALVSALHDLRRS